MCYSYLKINRTNDLHFQMQLTSMKKKLFTLYYLQNSWRFTSIFSLGGEIQVFTTVPIFARRMWDHKIWGDFICMEKAWLDLILKHICGILTITNDHQQHQYHHQRIPHFFYMLLCTKIEELTLDRSRTIRCVFVCEKSPKEEFIAICWDSISLWTYHTCLHNIPSGQKRGRGSLSSI